MTAKGETPVAVDSVDLERYAGLWYEIAKIPNRFQKKCDRNTTARYTLNEDGTIRVVNQCIAANGDTVSSEGRARVVDNTGNARLEVSFVSVFGFHLFWGDYWIIGLAGDYRYAVVGTPDRKYGWILSRIPDLNESDLQEVKHILKDQGYVFDRFVFTVQQLNQ